MNTIPTTVHMKPGLKLLVEGFARTNGISISRAGAMLIERGVYAKPSTSEPPEKPPAHWPYAVIFAIGFAAAALIGYFARAV